MSGSALLASDRHERHVTPVIECGVIGPHRQQGFLLRASRLETLTWDLDSEVASSRLMWHEDRSAWWVASSYLDTVIRIVLRSFPSVLVMHEEHGDLLYSRDGQTMLQQRLL
ncbi:hypothetical protein BH23GEM8_BH23GEM8_23510 [soil metagenome]